MRRAVTLVEMMVVIAIVAMITALSFPAMASAKAKAKQANCTAQMRQVGMGILQYRDDVGGEFESKGFDELVAGGYVPDKRILHCSADPTGGLMTMHYRCMNYKIQSYSSYYTPFAPVGGMWLWLQKFDNNPGILACRAHGAPAAVEPGPFCRQVPFLFDAHVLRMRLDGSIKLAAYSLRKDDGSQGHQFSFPALFTDVKIPFPH